MIRTNLSTRPFYNARAVHALLGLFAVIVLAITAYNTVELVRLWSSQRTLGAKAAANEREATRLRAEAAQTIARVDPRELAVVDKAAREANAIIDQRTFSWTAFFGLVEQTLPLDARLISVVPRVERGVFVIVMQVNMKRPDDLEAFMHSLAGTGAFYDLLPGEMQRNEDGLFVATLSGGYNAPWTGARSKTPARKGGPQP